MNRAPFRSPAAYQNGSSPDSAPEPATHRRSLPVAWLLVGAAGLIVVGAFIGIQVSSQQHKPAQRVLASAIVGPKNIELADYADGRAWLSFYHTYQDLLGEPQAKEAAYGKNADCIVFQNYVVCHSPDPALRGSDNEYGLLALGAQYVTDHHAPQQLDAPVAAPGQAYIDTALTAHGRDWLHWLGRVLSQPGCASSGDVCSQAFEHQILQWPNKADVAASEVRLTPLGVLYPTP